MSRITVIKKLSGEFLGEMREDENKIEAYTTSWICVATYDKRGNVTKNSSYISVCEGNVIASFLYQAPLR